jgi:hypothetical protein
MRLFVFCAVSAFASDFSGIWSGQIPSTRAGIDPQDVAIQIVQNGAKISGKMYGDYNSSPIVEGTISGNLITFVVKSAEQSGNEINDTRIRFTGSLQGGELELTRERESATRAGSNAGAAIRPGSKQTFKLKKL